MDVNRVQGSSADATHRVAPSVFSKRIIVNFDRNEKPTTSYASSFIFSTRNNTAAPRRANARTRRGRARCTTVT